MATSSDAAILDLYRAGHIEEAFRKLVAEHGDNVYNTALFTLSDEMLAQDASQEVFLRVYRNLKRFKGDAQLSTWLYRIVKNVCYDLLKKRKPERLEEGQESRLRDDSDTPETATMAQWEHRQLRDAVTQLPKFQRLALTLYYFQERSYEEVAEIMEQPLGTVKSHLHRGKAALGRLLGGGVNDE
ncbi:MAG: sigma-70 family RNA polymerase sigma factor [Candidatus Marinimicrobia bacterium]|nr:sigma-70 family RNA polymerase sigma factor [Candidatus Neomarinimicrobiota bacterium]